MKENRAQDGTRSDWRKASDPAPALNRAAAPIPTARLASALTPRVGDPDEGCGDGKSHAGPDESSGADSIPEGWALGVESWSFHRQFHERIGRPAAHREYTDIVWQILRHEAERLGPEVHRVKLTDGQTITVRSRPTTIVLSGRKHPSRILLGVRPLDEPQPAKRILRPTTLTLGNPATARVAAERLQRHFGIPADALIGAHAP
jgi:hypothetical protein